MLVLLLIKTISSCLDLILHHHLQSSPLGSAHTDASVSSVTFEMHPESFSLFGSLVSFFGRSVSFGV
jgi:hypothetical protein